MVYFLLIVLLILLVCSYVFTRDFLAPASIVCESFLLAYVCSIFSSKADGWEFDISGNTVLLIGLGLSSFLIGAFFCTYSKRSQHLLKKRSISAEPLYYNTAAVSIMLIVQIVLLVVYVYYFSKVASLFSALSWNSMMREMRWANSYGDGLDVSIPEIVQQSLKISKVNAYIALYYIMHNVAVRKFVDKRSIPGSKRLLIIVFLYVPYSILQSARFEIIVLIIGAFMEWYIFYMYYSNVQNKKGESIKKVISILIIVVFGAMILMSLLGTMVGRSESSTIWSEGYNYFGREIQALDKYINSSTLTNDDVRGAETFYGLFKLLSQLGIIKREITSMNLEFTSLGSYSLGNTYTAFRRYYNDFGTLGVMILPFIEGYILTRIYNKIKYTRNVNLNSSVIFYSMIAYALFFYAFDGYFFASVLSVNYFVIYFLVILVSGFLSGRISLSYNFVIKVRRAGSNVI